MVNKNERPRSAFRGVVQIYVSLVLALVFGLASSSLTAKNLSVSELGDYRFVLSCLSIVVSAMALGMFSSAGTILAGSRSYMASALTTSGVTIHALAVSGVLALFTAVLLAFSIHEHVILKWIVAAALSSVMVWPLLLQEILRARGKHGQIGLLNAGPPMTFVLLLIISQAMAVQMDTTTCLVMFFCGQGVVSGWLIMALKLKPKINLLGYVYLLKRNRRLGINVYVGSFLAVFAAQSGILILQGSRDAESVAVFSLALTLTAPLSLLPSAVGTAYFSQLPGAKGFPKRVLGSAWLSSILIAVIFCLLVPFAVQTLYGSRFVSVETPAEICGIGALLQGMGDVYNRYYLANRDTIVLLKIAILVCVAAVLVGVALGPLFGVLGVAFARLLSSGLYAGLLVGRYHVSKRRFAPS